MSRVRILVLLAVSLVLASTQASTQGTSRITTPRQQFGAAIGDDYFLATYTQLEAYWKTLDRESTRMSLVDIGRTEEGRTQWMAVVSSPENIGRLETYKSIARRLALAEGLTDADARALAAEGKAIVWIDGGIHADETLGAQQLIETVYQLVSRNDAETLRFLSDVIVLAVDANPDGHELVANWYMRQRVPTARTLAGLPTLYQKYAGHDNNRDFFMGTQAETRNINTVLFREWFPQIVYDHHQTSPPGTVMFAPPFREPYNYVFDPLIPRGVELFGAAMHARFAAEGKPGVTMRSGSNYSTWWNGGLRTTVYFHNQIGLLTETLGGPTPTQIPYVAEAQLASADLPMPIAPQPWRFRQAIDYSVTANRAVIDAASRNRETLLLNSYRMGRNSIERGSRDTWTPSPHRQARVGDLAARDPRGYIIPGDGPDMGTAIRFVNALLGSGVRVQRATTTFEIGGVRYPAGSFIVPAAQAFRPHVLDMFEPQDHPDDIPAPSEAPTPPYDNAGWTLAMQMGVRFVRVLDAFSGPFVAVTGPVSPDQTPVLEEASAVGFALDPRQNDAYRLVNRLLKAGAEVYWPRASNADGAARMYVPADPAARAVLRASRDVGATIDALTVKPAGPMLRITPVRVGVWDRYGGSEESGWVRWVLEQFEFPYARVFPKRLDAGNLAADFDVLIFPDGAIPGRDSATTYADGAPPLSLLPVPYREQTGVVTVRRTIPALREFAVSGGTVLTIGSSTALAEHLSLPLASALVAPDQQGRPTPLGPERFFVPGSILRASVDPQTVLGFGFGPTVDVMFNESPAFRIEAGGAQRGVRPVAWFADETPLRSGWAWGQAALKGAVAIADAPIGRGRVVAYGPEIVFRGQSHGTFRFLFNGILTAKAEALPVAP